MTHCPPWVATWRARRPSPEYLAYRRLWERCVTNPPTVELEDGVTLVYGTLVPNASAPARPREPASRVLTWPWDETKEKP